MRTGFIALLCAAVVGGCVTTETVQFKPRADQQSITRDGVPGLVSTRKDSIVIARPAAREFQIGGRPVFVIAIYNRSKGPEEFRVSNVSVTQNVNGNDAQLRVITYEELVSEEKTRQTIAAIATGLAVAGTAISASQAGYYNANSTVYTPRGAYQVHTTGYSPAAASIAQSNANAQNAELISATIERGQANMATLERAVIKDNTLMPGEWYGGQLHIAPLASQDGPKTYTISVAVGSDRHEIQISQGTPSS
ncbi:MAG: hypothetical protein WCD60_20645 [Pseudolabrys sp.]|jgi:hypothetical protein